MLRLLIVDDEKIILEALSEMIDYPDLGYELIATAQNGMEAYDIICDEYPDVVITDIRMPILNGLQLIERSIKSNSEITFILLSGYSEFEYAKQAMRYGVRHYILKPTDKQELIDALISIRNERLFSEEKKNTERLQLLQDLRFPLEQCFLMEALEYPEDFYTIFRRYQSLLSFPTDCVHACICSFVEESFLNHFSEDVWRILEFNCIPLQFPIIYVKNNAILIFPASTLTCQQTIQEKLVNLHYPTQSVALEFLFLHKPSAEALFYNILLKISRFDRILLLGKGNMKEIKNNIASPRKIKHLSKCINYASFNRQPDNQLLCSIFTDTMPLDSAKVLALSLYLNLTSENKFHPLNITYDVFCRLYYCANVQQIRELIQVVLLQNNFDKSNTSNSANISLLKSYVDQHLASESLSLKWLAENYLFVSVGYLSKQFIKEEGIRFSAYLNLKRIDEAKRLMRLYNSDNIKMIAYQVGFSNNPHYFSQVFKKYTGMTPTEYIDKIRK